MADSELPAELPKPESRLPDDDPGRIRVEANTKALDDDPSVLRTERISEAAHPNWDRSDLETKDQ